MRRVGVIGILALMLSVGVWVGGAQAFILSDGGNQYGVAYVPGTHPLATGSGSCTDPWLGRELGGPALPTAGVCFHSGAGVIHNGETFAITWDPFRSYWATTRDYVEQFLQDVADSSGSLDSPYALTTQYNGLNGNAGASMLYGGGCVDFGTTGGANCTFGGAVTSGPGRNYTTGCSITDHSYGAPASTACLTDSDIRPELTNMISQMGLTSHIQSGHSPLIVLLVPPGVDTCVDSTNTLCSANSAAAAQFCSYHSHIEVNGIDFAYVVQPWTPYTGCDEPDLPTLPSHPTAEQLATDAGLRIVNPLSAGQIAAIVNPDLNAWYALNDSELGDNDGCGPGGYPYDKVTLGNSTQNPYYIQPEFNNAGVIETDPNAPSCALGVALSPTFVVPSAIDAGDVVAFDGSTTVSTLMVPSSNYVWHFGDGTTMTGPSVEHSYSRGGVYAVTLTVTDRGGNTRTLTQLVTVLGPGGQLVGGGGGTSGLKARLELLPQGLRDVLHKGVLVRVSSNQPADGIATLLISRRAGQRAHIRLGRGASVVVGRGSISGIKDGTITLHIKVSRALAAKLSRLHHLTLTLRLKLITANRGHLTIDAAGRY